MQCGLEDESSQTSHRWESSKACRQNPWGFSSPRHPYTRHVWQHAGPPRYYPQKNKIMHVDGMLWTANSYATWRYQVPISFSAKLNQTQQIAWKMCYIFTFLELTKSEECVFKHDRSVYVPSVCLIKQFLTCLIQFCFLRFLQMVSKRNYS